MTVQITLQRKSLATVTAVRSRMSFFMTAASKFLNSYPIHRRIQSQHIRIFPTCEYLATRFASDVRMILSSQVMMRDGACRESIYLGLWGIVGNHVWWLHSDIILGMKIYRSRGPQLLRTHMLTIQSILSFYKVLFFTISSLLDHRTCYTA